MSQSDSLPPFLASKLKIERARLHLAEITSIRDLYFQRKPIRLVVEDWPEIDPATVAWSFRISEHPPAGISLPIGDAIHNLRTALDIAICDAVRVAGKSTKGVYFPFADSEHGIDEMIKRKNVRRAGSDIVALVKKLQPFHGGNWGLRSLHDFDVQDKHTMIIPAIATARIDLSGLMPSADEKTREELSQWSSQVADGYIAAAMPRSFSPPVGSVIEAKYWLAIFPGNSSSGEEVVHFIDELARITKSIVELIADNAISP